MKYIALFSLALVSLAPAQLRIDETKASITIRNGDAPVLTYHKQEVEPPEGASTLYRRSAFIHPLHAPNGAVVTSIHPGDHYHHVGLWHAWVNTKHQGKKVDFWNLKKGEGTIRYVKTESTTVGLGSDTSLGFTVIQHHVKLPDTVVLKESLTVLVRLHPDGHYLVDYDTVQQNVTADPLELPAYRYGGCIAYRGPEHWKNANSSVTTSEGKTRADGHTTRANWCRFSGPSEQGDVSVTILCHPRNHDAPQRQRIWPPKSHDGAIFYNYVPIQETGWSLEPGKPSSMRYRLVISNGTPDKAALDGLFKEYTK